MEDDPIKRVWRILPLWGYGAGPLPEEIARAAALEKERQEEAALEAAFRAAHPNLF